MITEKITNAIQCHQNGELLKAQQLYKEILSIDPQNADCMHFLGVIAMQKGNLDQAIHLIQRAIELRPDISGYHSNIAMAYKENDQFKESLEHYQHSISLSPENPILHFNLAALFHHYGQFDNARNAYVKSLTLKPDQPLVHHNLGNLLMKQGDVQGSLMAASIAKKLAPENSAIQSNYLFCLNYSIDHSPEMIINEHIKWGHFYSKVNDYPLIAEHHERIRIGYVSPDFRNHAVARFMKSILTNHDSYQFDIYCYSNVKQSDSVTNQLKLLDVSWRNIWDKNDDQAVQQIQSDNIHILVDLAGHSSNNRLTVFARQPAPIQITYLGYPNTTGLSQMHFRLVDQWSDPDIHQFSGSEDRLYLPNGFLCYTPDDNIPPITFKPSNKSITFGSFNNLPKVNMNVIQLWASVLQAVPNSRILIKTKGFNDTSTQDRYGEYFNKFGVKKDRITLMGTVPDETEHLKIYNHVDIALDTFPYNGTTTTCEALFMGVPVITLAGVHHAARVGLSILSQTGFSEWVAYNQEQYIQKAAYLADHPEEIFSIRKTLRSRLFQSDLCQGKKFVRSLESVYRSCFLKKLKPNSLGIS